MPNGIRLILWESRVWGSVKALVRHRRTSSREGSADDALHSPSPAPQGWNPHPWGSQSSSVPQWRKGKQMLCFFRSMVLLPSQACIKLVTMGVKGGDGGT